MKTFVVVLICALSLAQIKAWEAEDEICSQKLKIERKVLEELLTPGVHDIDNDVYNTFTECYWREKGWLNEDDTINWDKVINPEYLERITPCKEEKGENMGQTVVKITNCLVKIFQED